MPKKKKKRGPQAATPVAADDTLLLLQSQALAEEEEAKTKQEMLSRFLQVWEGVGSAFPLRAAQPPAPSPPLTVPRAGQAGQGAAQQRPEPPQAPLAVAGGAA